MSTTKQQARKAGVLYLLLALTAPIGLIYVPGQLIVAGNATATAEKLRASEWLMRLGIASELIHQIIVVFLALALYRLFKSVNENWAVLLVIFGAILPLPILFLNVVNDVAALMLANGGEVFSAFTRPQLDSLAYFFIELHGQGIAVTTIFWGLWLFPFGMLVIRSGFIPHFLGLSLMIAGTAYLLSAFAVLVMPSFMQIVSRIAMPMQLCEMPIVFWLLIWGARQK
jgi:hypothetical protein